MREEANPHSGGEIAIDVDGSLLIPMLLSTRAAGHIRARVAAVVGGNEVSNPFVVTEVYVQQNGTRKFGSLSFTRLLQ
jgi:hypothetical protein